MIKYIISILLIFSFLIVKSQLPTGFPTQANTGWTQWGYQQSTSGTIIATRDTLWTPRFCGTIVLWPHASVDTAYWMWDCVHWKKIASVSDIAIITANNGLTKTGNNIQLGGTLIQNTTVNDSSFIFTMTGTNASETALLQNTGSGRAIEASSIDAPTIEGTSTNASVFSGISTNGIPVSVTSTNNAAGQFSIIPSNTNSVITSLVLTRGSTGTASSGIGQRIDYYAQTSDGSSLLSNRLISKFTNNSTGFQSSQFIINGANVGSNIDLLTINGNGQHQLNQYTGTNFQTIDTSFNSLVVDGSGNIFKRSGDGNAPQNIQQTLTIGDTSLRAVIFKDTGNASTTHTAGNFLFVQPSNYGMTYGIKHASLFSSHGIAEFTGVNTDGRPNVVGTFWGYNHKPDASRMDTAEAAFGFRSETHYLLGVSSDPSFEFHLPEVTTYTGYTFRPLSMYIRKNTGFTNTNMQINQLNLLRQTDANFTWFSVVENNVSTQMTLTTDDDTKTHTIDFVLPSSIGTIGYSTAGMGLAASTDGKVLSTNMQIQYGSPTNRSGMDGYGDRISRESNGIVYNSGSNTNFCDWQYNSVQKYQFNKDFANFEAPILMNGQDIVTISGTKIRATSGDALRFQSNESGSGGDIYFINGADATRTMTLFAAASGDPTNVNIGPSTINPAHRFEVQGSAVVDSNLYVKMHDIASNSDSAVIWDRSTNAYKVAKINGTTATTIYTGDGTANNRTVTVTGSTMTFTSALTSPTPTLTVNNTSSGHGVLGSASGAGYGVYGSGFRGVYGTGTGGGTGVYGQETSGIGVRSVVTTGTSLEVDHTPTSFNDVQQGILISRTTSGNSGNGANGIGTYIAFAAPTTTTTSASIGGTLNWYWSTATNASRSGAFKLQTVTNAGALTDKMIVGDNFTLNTTTAVWQKVDGTVPYTSAIGLTSANNWQFGYTPTPNVFSKGNGITIDTNNNVSLGQGILSSSAPLYATGGSTLATGFQSSQGNFFVVSTITAGTTSISNQNYFVQCDASGGNVIINLPAASTVFGASMGVKYVFFRTDATGNTVTVNAAGGDSINGTGSFTLVGQYTTKQLQCVSSTKWAQY